MYKDFRLQIRHQLQQHLPFTVLKRLNRSLHSLPARFVATALTVYGIETPFMLLANRTPSSLVATALTVYGIETFINICFVWINAHAVATALTVYGIETLEASSYADFIESVCCNSTYRLRY